MWYEQDLTFTRTSVVVDGSPVQGRHWVHDGFLYAEYDALQKRFHINVGANRDDVQRCIDQIQTTSILISHWHKKCPYEDGDPKWISFLTHSSVSKFDNFLARLQLLRNDRIQRQQRATEDKRISAELAQERAEIERLEALWRDEDAKREAHQAAERERLRIERERLQAERDAQRKAEAERRERNRRAALAKLSDRLGLMGNDRNDLSVILEAIESLPIPDDIAEYLSRLNEREQIILIAHASSIPISYLGPLFNISRSRVVQIGGKADRRVRHWQEVATKDAAQATLVPKRPVHEMHVGPLMEWTAEMQAAEILAERVEAA